MVDLKVADKEVSKILEGEKKRQREGLEMIASENYVSEAVLELMGSIFTNKYSEGYPGKRYYGGQEWTDKVETLACERALKLFGLSEPEWHANVQPYSGSPANIAIYFALAEFGDTLMGMSLAQGGHLTHGHKVNFSGRAYNFIQYSVREDDQRINYDEVRDLARKHKPKIIVSGATAYPRQIDFKKFQEIADEVGAIHMADISHISGLIIGGVHPSPFPFVDVVMTTTHKTLRGPRGAMIICKEKYAKAIDKAVFPGLQGGPHEHIIAAKAVAFGEALKPNFKEYAKNIVNNMSCFAKTLSSFDFNLVSGGTDNHLCLVDLRSKNITGKEFEDALGKAEITVNKNAIPGDPLPPAVTSGIRVGVAALTTRGMGLVEMQRIAELFNLVYENKDNDEKLAEIKEEVREMCLKFPVPGINK
ncbi:MAG: serine hydroxymethyltransferase [Patescibacteria group bacterium]|nr:serine hydroxymethyltransferase [Patescibacteria group bacterium]